MICPKCQELGLKSKVHSRGSSSTLLYYPATSYDEDGNLIFNRDPNTYEHDFECSCGHKFTVSTKEGEKDKITVW